METEVIKYCNCHTPKAFLKSLLDGDSPMGGNKLEVSKGALLGMTLYLTESCPTYSVSL